MGSERILWLIYNIWICFVITLIIFFIRYVFQYFHPLYAFWNLWEKIQSLTPNIETQSTKIREIFSHEETIDYKTLHHSFDTLSDTFEKIASLVIRLEKIEIRANTWNLFDSKKYIESLKDDILTPLSSLSTFLGEKETELREKQDELSNMRFQVQVGWSDRVWSDESWQTSLISARIRPLIEEIGRQRASIWVMMEHVARL
jgi:hypothetical protein